MPLRAMHLTRVLSSHLQKAAPGTPLMASRLVGSIPRARAALRKQAPILLRGRKLIVRVSTGSALGVRALLPLSQHRGQTCAAVDRACRLSQAGWLLFASTTRMYDTGGSSGCLFLRWGRRHCVVLCCAVL